MANIDPKYFKALEKKASERTPEEHLLIFNNAPAIVAELSKEEEGYNEDWLSEIGRDKDVAIFFYGFYKQTKEQNRSHFDLKECVTLHSRILCPIGEEYLRKKLRKYYRQGWLDIKKTHKTNKYGIKVNGLMLKEGLKKAEKILGIYNIKEKEEKKGGNN